MQGVSGPLKGEGNSANQRTRYLRCWIICQSYRRNLEREDTIGRCGIKDGDHVDFHQSQLGGKPVIYVYSPIDVQASVKLLPIPEWRFSTVYPFTHTTIIMENVSNRMFRPIKMGV
ncbi:hypothetical protein PILCRDRAFT_135549 [Piloderma croceum F 1598]|uniref:Ubiquitin-like domain-containing protein n=1 Tax=Piloderma croceum (strain F 1598) TaxID=765440 RepID=A0A0C3GMA8_PILCF|nr:hypothetical protein PILCRDRAFT_135549 [Piloderma croceum F 1598]